MSIAHAFAYFLVSLLSSIAGAICGIGGGVIIKPTLDFFRLDSVATVSFLSGCTVLAMSCYSVLKNLRSHENRLDLKRGTPLGLGAAIGGVAGKSIFSIASAWGGAMVGAIQSACLFVMVLFTLVYTLKKARIKTHRIDKSWVCVLIGLVLGVLSSFLGIGGGPINLVVLYFFFSMDTKTAAQNSLYIILLSQSSSFIFTFIQGAVPAFQPLSLILMVMGGIGGGILGNRCNKRIGSGAVDNLFIGLMVVIMAISIYNVYRYAFGV